MRWILSLLAMVALGISGIVRAQTESGVANRNGHVIFDAPEIDDLNIVKIFFRGGCFAYVEAGNGNYIGEENRDFTWSGQCISGQPVNGSGKFKDITQRGGRYDGVGDWTEVTVNFVDGIMNGKSSWTAFIGMNQPDSQYQNGSENYVKGCIDSLGRDSFDYCSAEFSTLADRLKARNSQFASSPVDDRMRGAASATGGAVGQNRGKGGNPDWMYDDADHGKCVSVEAVSATGGSGLAYGHYKLINRCAYPIKVRTCITPDRLDGSDSNYDLHQDGVKCPGMGWLGGGLKANEVQNGREWFEYNRLKWDIQACREGWDFVGEDDRYPSDILGVPYGCRTRRPSK